MQKRYEGVRRDIDLCIYINTLSISSGSNTGCNTTLCMILIVASLVELYQKCGKQNKILLYLRKEIKHHHPTIHRLVVLSLTSVICKVMDKLVRKRIVEHKSNKYLISNKQFGFICRRSTRHRTKTNNNKNAPLCTIKRNVNKA